MSPGYACSSLLPRNLRAPKIAAATPTSMMIFFTGYLLIAKHWLSASHLHRTTFRNGRYRGNRAETTETGTRLPPISRIEAGIGFEPVAALIRAEIETDRVIRDRNATTVHCLCSKSMRAA